MLSGWRAHRRFSAELDRAEDELREAQQRIGSLEQELAARTAAAESAAKELDALTYGISHDLRAPLRAIEGFARILEDDYGPTLGNEGQGHLQIVREAAKKLDRLIDSMLTLSRIGRQPLEYVDVDMTQLARKAVDEARRARGAALAEIVIHDLPPVRGDSGLLHQLWAQLVDNAFKFSSGANPPRIEIGGRADEESVFYHVKDNGVGYDMRYGSKLFNVFQRLHSEREFPGLGVGLAIVYRIIGRHGGRVWAEGERGKGACFHFALPRDRGAQAEMR